MFFLNFGAQSRFPSDEAIAMVDEAVDIVNEILDIAEAAHFLSDEEYTGMVHVLPYWIRGDEYCIKVIMSRVSELEACRQRNVRWSERPENHDKNFKVYSFARKYRSNYNSSLTGYEMNTSATVRLNKKELSRLKEYIGEQLGKHCTNDLLFANGVVYHKGVYAIDHSEYRETIPNHASSHPQPSTTEKVTDSIKRQEETSPKGTLRKSAEEQKQELLIGKMYDYIALVETIAGSSGQKIEYIIFHQIDGSISASCATLGPYEGLPCICRSVRNGWAGTSEIRKFYSTVVEPNKEKWPSLTAFHEFDSVLKVACGDKVDGVSIELAGFYSIECDIAQLASEQEAECVFRAMSLAAKRYATEYSYKYYDFDSFFKIEPDK